MARYGRRGCGTLSLPLLLCVLAAALPPELDKEDGVSLFQMHLDAQLTFADEKAAADGAVVPNDKQEAALQAMNATGLGGKWPQAGSDYGIALLSDAMGQVRVAMSHRVGDGLGGGAMIVAIIVLILFCVCCILLGTDVGLISAQNRGDDVQKSYARTREVPRVESAWSQRSLASFGRPSASAQASLPSAMRLLQEPRGSTQPSARLLQEPSGTNLRLAQPHFFAPVAVKAEGERFVMHGPLLNTMQPDDSVQVVRADTGEPYAHIYILENAFSCGILVEVPPKCPVAFFDTELALCKSSREISLLRASTEGWDLTSEPVAIVAPSANAPDELAVCSPARTDPLPIFRIKSDAQGQAFHFIAGMGLSRSKVVGRVETVRAGRGHAVTRHLFVESGFDPALVVCSIVAAIKMGL